jgi:tetratricopeptide (TPR) repeat protein
MNLSEARIGMRFIAAIMFLPLLAGAAEDPEKLEQARKEAFRNGVAAIVDDLNRGSFRLFTDAIDRDDMVDRIYGLRLIDQQVKKQFNQSMEYSFDGFIESAFSAPKDGLKAKLLGVESRGDRGRAVVRFDYPRFEFNYHEYELRLDGSDRVVVVDWVDYFEGLEFSESAGRSLVMAAPSQAAMRKLLDTQNVNQGDWFQFGELLKAARDTELERYLEIRDRMNPRMQQQRIVIETSAQIARHARKRRPYIAAVGILAEAYPDEPRYALMLLDYFFPSRKYAEAMQALQGLSDELDFPDSAMAARMSATALVMGDAQEASALADQALELEPGLELGWWSALGARIELADYKGSVEILQKLESDFGHELTADKLKKNRQYAQLLSSPEFQSWVESKPAN